MVGGEFVDIVEGVLCHANQMLSIEGGDWGLDGDAQREDGFADLSRASAGVVREREESPRCLRPIPSCVAAAVLPCRWRLS